MATAVAGKADLSIGDAVTPDIIARRVAQRRQMLLLVGLSYGVDAAVLLIYALAGTTSLLVPAGYLVSGLSLTAIFLALSETHVNDGFADHYLTSAQNAASALLQLIWVLLAPEVGYFFLCILFVVFGFGSLRSTSRQAAIGWTLVTIGIACIFLMTSRPIEMPTASYADRVATMLCFVLTIGRCVFVGLFGSTMRETLYKRSTQLRQAYERIEELAQLDDLTGTLNRRYIMKALDDEVARIQRSSQISAVALIDLDNFKSINDRFGHPVGDEALRTFAMTLFANLRSTDKFGRYGGEEFLLVLPDVTADSAAQTLNRLRSIVADLDWTAISSGMTVTISIGMTIIRKNDSIDMVLTRADRALYDAKNMGRNCLAVG